VAVRGVLAEFARCSVGQRLQTSGWPLLGAEYEDVHLWPPGDPAAVVFDGTVPASDAHGPPDVVVGQTGRLALPIAIKGEAHPVTGGPAFLIDTGPELSWEQLGQLSEAEVSATLGKAGTASLGALDDKVINPIGFRDSLGGDIIALRPVPGHPESLSFDAGDSPHVIDTRRGLADADIAKLRDVKGIAVDWTGGWGPHAYCRLVAGLSMAGISLLAESPPEWSRALLSEGLLAELERRPNLDNPLAREEASIELRRAALAGHSSRSWRRSLARAAGAQVIGLPLVSILLCTRRPEMLPFAIRQIARQRYSALEVVVAAHGFELSVDDLRELAPLGLAAQAVSVGADVPFGDALNFAADRASGDLFVKMDDDDWYGPDFVSDLELARMYSGADIVGCPPEFTFLEHLWLTTRSRAPTEVYRRVVAGGTIMVDRSVFREVGGFRRVHRHVDASLLTAVSDAGGTIFRSHGLGYVLRRNAAGHTWDPGVGYFLARARVAQQWRGFRPSKIVHVDEVDVPQRGTNADWIH
jgi:hypothetical protein